MKMEKQKVRLEDIPIAFEVHGAIIPLKNGDKIFEEEEKKFEEFRRSIENVVLKYKYYDDVVDRVLLLLERSTIKEEIKRNGNGNHNGLLTDYTDKTDSIRKVESYINGGF